MLSLDRKMRFKSALLILLVTLCHFGFGQKTILSPSAQVSVITCGPGYELYTSFGHSAFRIQDPVRGLDLIYNYGTFDFDASNFYINFARGRPIYTLSRQQFVNFLYTYQLENRWVKEQILDLSATEIEEIFLFLENNYLPENRDYKYDYINENCSTKIPEVLRRVLGPSLVFKDDHLEEERSIRELMQHYLRWNSWGSLGIDLALGAVIDRKAKAEQTMFLPDYVLYQMNNSTFEDRPLVMRQRTILDLSNGNPAFYFTISPLFWTLFLMIFTLTITWIDFRNQTRSRWLDFILNILTGATGLLISYLWFFSDHSAAAYNFNILWGFPANIVIAFYLTRKEILPNWIPRYNTFMILCLSLIPLLWISGIQRFHPIVFFILLTLGVRYGYLYHYFRKTYPVWVRDFWKSKK